MENTEVLTRLPRLYPEIPTVGLVIGTYAAVPYIHLQLESRRRYYPHVPTLVHDDGSGRYCELEVLCAVYGADFQTNAKRQPPTLGDLTAFVDGLVWARERQLDLLLKVSRRWIFQTDWTSSLIDLAQESQYATLGSYTTAFGFGFRSECLAMSVSAWTLSAIFDDLTQAIQRTDWVFVEVFLHHLARHLEEMQCEDADRWRSAHPAPYDRNGYALWRFMGTSRSEKSPVALWHDSHSSDDYYKLAVEWKLPYSHNDFVDPNQGEGNGV